MFIPNEVPVIGRDTGRTTMREAPQRCEAGRGSMWRDENSININLESPGRTGCEPIYPR